MFCLYFEELDNKGQTHFFSFFPPPVLARYDELYAFSYNPKQNEEERVRGWQIIDLTEEYNRMGVPNSEWQLSDANHDYKVIGYLCIHDASVSFLVLSYFTKIE